ncbi:MAG: YdcF family protein [Reyranella sp.]|uniref:YdcF family protein n=1 Tax=Reyranella sp. TaxID=1929291 RepID=UPI00120D7725|nr:YdcF family protein [Reyranella sp.]TAJ41171.1 MAG: YdcF family protein [Reyranella sp.]
MDTFVLLKFLAQLALPPASLAVGLVVAIALALLGLRRLARLVAVLAVAELLVLAMPPVADALVAPLQNEARAAAKAAPACCYDAIVVLGGGIGPALPPDVPEPHLTDSADRIWHAARLYHRGLAPRIIASGGGAAEMSEAEAMRLFLTDLGVPAQAIVLEGNSLNTIENIRHVRTLVKDGRVALVTSASHMQRALRLARTAGLNVAAFPTDWSPPAEGRASWENWLPSLGALSVSTIALKEILANAFDRRGASLTL